MLIWPSFQSFKVVTWSQSSTPLTNSTQCDIWCSWNHYLLFGTETRSKSWLCRLTTPTAEKIKTRWSMVKHPVHSLNGYFLLLRILSSPGMAWSWTPNVFYRTKQILCGYINLLRSITSSCFFSMFRATIIKVLSIRHSREYFNNWLVPVQRLDHWTGISNTIMLVAWARRSWAFADAHWWRSSLEAP